MAEYILVHGIRVAKSFLPETFGRLTTIGPTFWLNIRGRRGHQRAGFQVCQCACGKHTVVRRSYLASGHTKSCSCLAADTLSKSRSNHRESCTLGNTSEYRCWCKFKRRCLAPNDRGYIDYGGRGIRVCERWLGSTGFQNFLADMGRKPSPAYSIDRIDVNGDYCPENCRWATRTQQNNNTRRNIVLTHAGRSMTMAEWSRETGIDYKIIHSRVQIMGWSAEDALTRPIRQISKRGPNR
jgi:hypothetical protein